MLKRLINSKTVGWGIAVVLLLIFLKFSKWNEPAAIENDVKIYYAYLPAAFIYHDLSFGFLDTVPARIGEQIWIIELNNGARVPKMTMGMAVLYLPFFGMAQLTALLTDKPADGYSYIYQFFIALSSLVYAFAAIVVLRKLLRRYFADKVVALTLIIVFLGTNLFYYVTNEGPMSHSYSFCLFALLLYLTILWHDRPSWKYSILLGLIAGLIVLVRPANLLVLIVPLLYLGNSDTSFRNKISWFISNRKYGVATMISACVVWSVQLLYWKIYTGSWWLYAYGNEGFHFSSPHIINGLFSFRNGWLIYTPLAGAAIIGFIWLFRKLPQFSWAISIFLLVNTYVVYSWWCWWYGGSFGSRPMIEILAVLSIPLACFNETVLNAGKWKRAGMLTIIFSLVCLNLFQSLQYKHKIIHWDGMTKEAYTAVFGKLERPANYNALIKVPDYEKALKREENR